MIQISLRFKSKSYFNFSFYETLFSSEDIIEEKYLIEEADRSSENLLAKYFVSVMAWAKVIEER